MSTDDVSFPYQNKICYFIIAGFLRVAIKWTHCKRIKSKLNFSTQIKKFIFFFFILFVDFTAVAIVKIYSSFSICRRSILDEKLFFRTWKHEMKSFFGCVCTRVFIKCTHNAYTTRVQCWMELDIRFESREWFALQQNPSVIEFNVVKKCL